MHRIKSYGLLLVLFVLGIFLLHSNFRTVSTDAQQFYAVRVVQIIEQGETKVLDTQQPFQKVKVRILNGDSKDNELIVSHGTEFTITKDQLVTLGEDVVVSVDTNEQGEETYRITDKYRIPELIGISLLFLLVVIIFSGKQGMGAIIGLLLSALVILQFVVPQILAGREPVTISIIGACFILVATMYLAHGVKASTTIALLSTAVTLAISGIISFVAVNALGLTGIGSEEAYMLKLGAFPELNLKGLLLGGMILGILGILDDVTTSQVAAVFAIDRENQKLTMRQLIERGLVIGREHIAALVNTLVLAYAGVSFPLFIFFVLNPLNQPVWVLFNSEFMTEEIVRTLSGSFGLVLGVPISTIFAAWAIKKRLLSPKESDLHIH